MREERTEEEGGGVSLHIVGKSNLAGLISNDWEGELAARDLIDILDPSSVRLNGVGRETNQLDSALCEFGLEFGKGAELGGADGGVIFGVGEEDNPLVADELVEVDGTSGGLGLEVGGDGTQSEAGEEEVSI